PNMLSGARYLPLLVPERRLFELGRTFACEAGQPVERRTAAWLVLRGQGPLSWHRPDVSPDLYTLRAEATGVLGALGVPIALVPGGPAPFPFVPDRSLSLIDEQGRVAGYVGELEARAYGVRQARACYGVELYLPPPRREPPSPTPRREAESLDISLIAASDTSAVSVQRAICEWLGVDLLDARLVDVYTGEGIGEGRRSLTYSVVYRAGRGEPGAVWADLRDILQRQLGVEVRG
ncbi:MAG: hypothetical protein M3281_00755, partial [Chloroflexota bacterium]|nr:hypothetical protein [Chloroflexota bacterium]